MSKKLRIHQFLSRTGEFKNKNYVWHALRSHEIKVDGEPINNPHFQIKVNKANVTWKDKKLSFVNENVYFILNKPEGYLSSRLSNKDDELGKESVYSLIKEDEKLKRMLFCVGRLDEDSKGLLIITNDGNIIPKINDPKSHVEKRYYCKLKYPVNENDIKKVEAGVEIELEDNGIIDLYTTKPCKVKVIKNNEVEIVIDEGKKREIKRIFEAIGNKVIELKRIAIGNLQLRELNITEGDYISVEKEFLEERLFGKK